MDRNPRHWARTPDDENAPLTDQGQAYTDAPCLIATDGESYTYNNRINRLSTIQEHLLIQRAVKQGVVTPAKLAEALDVDVKNIVRKLKLLDGIAPEGQVPWVL